jgi:hypothetical protein
MLVLRIEPMIHDQKHEQIKLDEEGVIHERIAGFMVWRGRPT